MRKLIVLGLMISAAAAIAIVSYPARGTCETGIRKEHLDATPGEFADGQTIEISPSVGLKIKDGAVNKDSIDKFLSYDVVPRWLRKHNTASNLTLPTQFTANEFQTSLISMGEVCLSSSSTTMSGSTLLEMKVYVTSATGISQYLNYVDDNVYAYIDGTLEWSSTGIGEKNATEIWDLTQGPHTLQIVVNNSGGGATSVALFGDIVNNSNIYYVAP